MKYLLTLQSLLIQLRSQRLVQTRRLGCSAPRQHLMLEALEGEQGGHLGHQSRPRAAAGPGLRIKLVSLRGPGRGRRLVRHRRKVSLEGGRQHPGGRMGECRHMVSGARTRGAWLVCN